MNDFRDYTLVNLQDLVYLECPGNPEDPEDPRVHHGRHDRHDRRDYVDVNIMRYLYLLHEATNSRGSALASITTGSRLTIESKNILRGWNTYPGFPSGHFPLFNRDQHTGLM